MKDPIQPQRCADLLGALAAPERLRIIRYLRGGARTVSEIAEMLGAPPVNVSHHLAVLRQAGMVRNRKQGRFVYYSLPPGLLQQAADADPIEFLNLGCCRLEVPRSEEEGSDAGDLGASSNGQKGESPQTP